MRERPKSFKALEVDFGYTRELEHQEQAEDASKFL